MAVPNNKKLIRRAIILAALLLLLIVLVLASYEAATGNIYAWYLGPKYLSEDGYIAALGLDGDTFQAVTDAYGEPLETQLWADGMNNPMMDVFYPNLVLHCYFPNGDASRLQEAKVCGMVVTSPVPRFGWLRIGVGSPEWLVRLAYLPDSRLSESRLGRYRVKYDPDIGFLCGSLGEVLFRFDERHRLECLVVT